MLLFLDLAARDLTPHMHSQDIGIISADAVLFSEADEG